LPAAEICKKGDAMQTIERRARFKIANALWNIVRIANAAESVPLIGARVSRADRHRHAQPGELAVRAGMQLHQNERRDLRHDLGWDAGGRNLAPHHRQEISASVELSGAVAPGDITSKPPSARASSP
jgi:hypothetical protein